MSYRVCSMAVLAGTAESPASTLVGFTTGADVSEAAEEIDVSVTGNCEKSYLAGPVETTITLDAFSQHLPGTDPLQDPGQAVVVPGAQISLTLHPNGTGSGKPALSWLNVAVTGRTFAGVVDGAWTWNVTCRSNSPTVETAQA